MSKVIEFPGREKRMAKFLREQLPFELPAETLAELAAELQKVVERIAARRQPFTLLLPSTCTEDEMEFITRQVEEMVAELMRTIKGEEEEIFNLVIRYHLLLHEMRQILDAE
jgi:hypothetical protein